MVYLASSRRPGAAASPSLSEFLATLDRICCGGLFLPGGWNNRLSETITQADIDIAGPYQLCSGGFSDRHPQKNFGSKSRLNGDAFIHSRCLALVADGVNSVELEGIDPSRLPRELLMYVCGAFRERTANPSTYDAETARLYFEFLPQRLKSERCWPAQCLIRAVSRCKEAGSTTFCGGVLEGTQFHVLNIGDSGLLLLRPTKHSKAPQQQCEHGLVYRTSPGVYWFNMPFQISRMAMTQDRRCEERLLENTANTLSQTTLALKVGDVMILGSDGVFDNLYDEEIVAIFNGLAHAEGTFFSSGVPIPKVNPHVIAKAIVQAAFDAACVPSLPGRKAKRTPYGDALLRYTSRGWHYGKPDDTTVVVAYVVPNQKRGA